MGLFSKKEACPVCDSEVKGLFNKKIGGKKVLCKDCSAQISMTKELLKDALKKLSERERKIMFLRFGLNGGEEMTQKDVADLLGISQSYISRLEKKIIQRLRKEISKMV